MELASEDFMDREKHKFLEKIVTNYGVNTQEIENVNIVHEEWERKNPARGRE